MHLELVSVAEIAETLGVTRSRASQLTFSEDFPEPYAVLRIGPIWDKREVDAWIETWPRRVGRPPRT